MEKETYFGNNCKRTTAVDLVVNSTPEYMERIAEELFLTVSKYIEITPENFTVQITQSDIHIQLAGEKK